MSTVSIRLAASGDALVEHPAAARRRAPWADPRRAARRWWWAVVIALDLALLPLALAQRATEASLVAVLVAVLARHDGVVAALGRMTAGAPGYRRHQLIYHLGQLHRAAALSATGWLIVASLQVASQWLVAVLAAVAVALSVMAWTARDAIRGSRHERFESIHRYVGWAVLLVLAGVVAAELGIALAAGHAGRALPSLLLLSAVGSVVAHPWIGVRRVPVEVLEVTPSLVLIAVPGRRRVGEFLRISLDGREWHTFAASTSGREGPGRLCLAIRRAGDWTERLGRLCESEEPPTSLLTRRLRGFGFMGHAQAYARVLVIATGAGIGPVLLYLLDQRQPGLHCVWIARDHRAAMGSDLVDRVVAGGQTTLVDTAAGRPSMTGLVRSHAPTADAVFVVSNRFVRDEVAAVVAGLGLPCYGPTFDS